LARKSAIALRSPLRGSVCEHAETVRSPPASDSPAPLDNIASGHVK
jgi:hypothetical protein